MEASEVMRLKSGAAEPLAVLDDRGSPIAQLVPITAEMAAGEAIPALLSAWRRRHKHGFLTVFEPSADSARIYLQTVSVPDTTRLLFLVRDAKAGLVGNIGLCNITAREAEMDYVLRGEAASPGLMHWVHRSLLRFAFETLRVERVYLHVRSDNPRALAAYERAGFQRTGERRLTREAVPGGYRLAPTEGEGDADAPTLLRMEVARSNWSAGG